MAACVCGGVCVYVCVSACVCVCGCGCGGVFVWGCGGMCDVRRGRPPGISDDFILTKCVLTIVKIP